MAKYFKAFSQEKTESNTDYPAMTPFPALLLPVASTGIYYAFAHSDLLGQAICIVLFLFSIAVWVVMVEKIVSLNAAMRLSKEFVRQFREKRNPLGLREKAMSGEALGPSASVYRAACERIQSFRLENPGGGRRAMNDDELDIIQTAMNQAVEDQILLLERRMIFLATAVSASPFLGLFGTVWGITIAFTDLASSGRADIQTLAPGISGALLTTVVGLVVAIPSLVGYNVIAAHVKRFTVHLDNFAEEVHSRFKIEQLDSFSAANGRQ